MDDLSTACRSGLVPVLALVCTLLGTTALGLAQAGAPARPAPVAVVGAQDELPARYAATRRAVLAAQRAEERSGAGEGGRTRRARALAALAAPGRQLLAFDARGRGLVSEVLGDLATARSVAVVVGGVGTDLDSFEDGTLLAAARALATDAGPAAAVVAWADYVSPASLGPQALRDEAARVGGDRLRRFLGSLASAQRPVVLVCHSYGSPVCARALADGRAHGVSDVVDLASPGVGDGRLPAGVRRWAALGEADPVRLVPRTSREVLGLRLGLGRDPLSLPGTRALPVPARCDHDDYVAAGSPTRRALAALLAAAPSSSAPPSRTLTR
ncbi:alpha/beta hydrolase [Kineococcus sp. SYSU DK006]|uniref:alpha/beta hydrolase n=1 Tax=Kineococcus sp. SYSU DK006 TaxID=3383127 RepID=UPI003D7DF7F5